MKVIMHLSPRYPNIHWVKENVSILNIQVQTSNRFLEIKSHPRHIFVHKHYDAESPNLHDQRQIILSINQKIQFQR